MKVSWGKVVVQKCTYPPVSLQVTTGPVMGVEDFAWAHLTRAQARKIGERLIKLSKKK